MVEVVIAGITAGALTLFDLDRVFYIPDKIEDRIKLRCWWWGFILANAFLGGAFYLLLADNDQLKPLTPAVRALVLGASYMAVIRLKVTTIDRDGKSIPLGLELLYEGAKDFFFKRINRIAIEARNSESMQLASSTDLRDLKWRASHRARVDALASGNRARIEGWIDEVVNDKIQEFEKKLALADYILSGQI